MDLTELVSSIEWQDSGLKPSAYELANAGVKYLNDPTMIKEFYKEFVNDLQRYGMLPGVNTAMIKNAIKNPVRAADDIIAAELHDKRWSIEKVGIWLDSLPKVLASYIAQDIVSKSKNAKTGHQ